MSGILIIVIIVLVLGLTAFGMNMAPENPNDIDDIDDIKEKPQRIEISGGFRFGIGFGLGLLFLGIILSILSASIGGVVLKSLFSSFR